MAVNATVLNKTVRLSFEVGIDGDGNPVMVNRSYRNIKTDAEDQNIFDASQIMADMQENILTTVTKVEESQLAEV